MTYAVYTALFGGYEELVEQPIAKDSKCEFICFTDDANLRSETYRVEVIEPRFHSDPTRSARQLKIMGDARLAGFEKTLWIDNRIVLKRRPELLTDLLLGDSSFGVVQHDHRQSVRDEYTAVWRGHLDDPWRVRSELAMLKSCAPAVLEQVPLWSAIIARREGAEIGDAMRLWMDLVLRYSRRDQLSLNFALETVGVVPNVLMLPNRECEWYSWITVEQLPKLKGLRYARGDTYSLLCHLWDSLATNRGSRFLRSLLGG